MKRIDDKIKEIEKKEKKYRIMYIAFVALIFVFMATAFIYQGIIDKQRDSISMRDDTIKESKQELLKKRDSLAAALEELNRSLQPEKYWESTKKENSVEGYIAFITKDWGIDTKDFLPDAIKELQTSGPEVTGFRGWLFVGEKFNDGTYIPREEKIEVIYRGNKKVDPNKEPEIANSEPQIGDIVKLKATRNQKTYINKPTNLENDQGWRNKTKAFVVDTYKEEGITNFHIEIRYY